MKTVLTESMHCPVQPSDINTHKHFWKAFGNRETETSAHYIVVLCQQKEKWEPFNKKEIERVYQEAGHRSFYFNQLITDGWIVEKNGLYHITLQFIARVWGTSPTIKTKND